MNDKHGSFTRSAFGLNGSMMQLDDFFYITQPDSESFHVMPVPMFHTIKSIKYHLQI